MKASIIMVMAPSSGLQVENYLNRNISVDDESQMLQEVTIIEQAGGRSLSSAQTSVEKLTMKEIEHIPVLFGERDVLKAIQLLQGIKAAGDGNSGMFVRGPEILIDPYVMVSHHTALIIQPLTSCQASRVRRLDSDFFVSPHFLKRF